MYTSENQLTTQFQLQLSKNTADAMDVIEMHIIHTQTHMSKYSTPLCNCTIYKFNKKFLENYLSKTPLEHFI